MFSFLNLSPKHFVVYYSRKVLTTSAIFLVHEKYGVCPFVVFHVEISHVHCTVCTVLWLVRNDPCSHPSTAISEVLRPRGRARGLDQPGGGRGRGREIAPARGAPAGKGAGQGRGRDLETPEEGRQKGTRTRQRGRRRRPRPRYS